MRKFKEEQAAKQAALVDNETQTLGDGGVSRRSDPEVWQPTASFDEKSNRPEHLDKRDEPFDPTRDHRQDLNSMPGDDTLRSGLRTQKTN